MAALDIENGSGGPVAGHGSGGGGSGSLPSGISLLKSGLLTLLYLLCSVLVGASGPLQGGVNVYFGAALGSGIFSSFIMFSLNVLVFVTARAVELRRLGKPMSEFFKPPPQVAGSVGARPLNLLFYCIPGMCGVTFVFATVFLLPQLGFGLFFVVLVSAAMTSSVVVDHVGFLGARRVHVNRWSIVGLVVSIAGNVGGGAL